MDEGNHSCKLTPKCVLVFMTAISIIIYIDRGALSAIIPILQEDSTLNLNPIEAGSLGSLFMLGYMITCPIFAHEAQFIHPLYLMAIGLVIWSLAVLSISMVNSFWPLAVARAFTGIGEASFISLSPPYIMEVAPEQHKSMWLAIFFASMPIGYAIGFVYGNSIYELTNAWYAPFAIEGIAIIPLIIISLFVYKDPSLLARKQIGDSNEYTTMTICQQFEKLAKNPIFVCLSLGYGAYAFTVGGISYWGPDFLQKYFNLSASSSTLWLGGITIFCGLVATIHGSWILDKRLVKENKLFHDGLVTEEEIENTRTREATLILLISMTLGTIIAVIGSLTDDFYPFIICLAIGEYMIFLGHGPLGIALMTCVSKEMRGQSNAISIFITHLVGDFPSPFLIGVWFETIGLYWGMFCVTAWLSWSAIFMGFAWNFARYKGQSTLYVLSHLFKRSKEGIKNSARDVKFEKFQN